jgi:hypothetical protein
MQSIQKGRQPREIIEAAGMKSPNHKDSGQTPLMAEKLGRRPENGYNETSYLPRSSPPSPVLVHPNQYQCTKNKDQLSVP